VFVPFVNGIKRGLASNSRNTTSVAEERRFASQQQQQQKKEICIGLLNLTEPRLCPVFGVAGLGEFSTLGRFVNPGQFVLSFGATFFTENIKN
jgi:hypothetical protein